MLEKLEISACILLMDLFNIKQQLLLSLLTLALTNFVYLRNDLVNTAAKNAL